MAGPPGPPGPPGPTGAAGPPGTASLASNRLTALEGRINGLEQYGSQIGSLHLSFDELRAESHEATAIAIALGGVRIPRNQQGAFSLRLGNFRSGNALAAAGAFRLPESPVVIDLGISHGFEYSQTGFAAGVTWSW